MENFRPQKPENQKEYEELLKDLKEMQDNK